MFRLTATAVAWCTLASLATVHADETVLLSVDSTGSGQANNTCERPQITPSGRFVSFSSLANNLVSGDVNGVEDVFLYDAWTGRSERISLPQTTLLDGDSNWADVSDDGRRIVFQSDATNLVAGDTNGVSDIFLHDRDLSVTIRVSIDSVGGQGNGPSEHPAISPDGRYVVFSSSASNLVSGDSNGAEDIFVHDVVLDETWRVSVSSSGTQGSSWSADPGISRDGATVVFRSDASNLVAGDTNGQVDVFVHDLATGQTSRVSVDSLGQQGDQRSGAPSISADGRRVAFDSLATNLVSGDSNGNWDVFLHDRDTATTTRVSVSSNGTQASGLSARPSLSPDGGAIGFWSSAADLVPGDTNGRYDMFVHDLLTGVTRRVSVHTVGPQGNEDSEQVSVSYRGREVAFVSTATTLVDGVTSGVQHVYARRRTPLPNLTRASVSSLGQEGNNHSHAPSLDAAADQVAFHSHASNFDQIDTNNVEDVFVHDLRNRSTMYITHDRGTPGNGPSSFPSMAPAGWEVVFQTWASNLEITDTNGYLDIYTKYDHGTFIEFERISQGPGVEANDNSDWASAGDTGVAFETLANNLLAGDTNGFLDIYVSDRFVRNTRRVSVSSAGAEANGPSAHPDLSTNERYVAFDSQADNLVPGDTNLDGDIFVHDLVTRTTWRVSVDSAGNQGNGWSEQPAISGDGRYVAFCSYATNLVAGDTNGSYDIFVHDRTLGLTTRVSVDSNGAQANAGSYRAEISADGRHVAFFSDATNLVPGDTNGIEDVFVHDRVTGTTTRVSTSSWGDQGTGECGEVSLSADGGVVAFESSSPELVPDDSNSAWDVFVKYRSRVLFDQFGEGWAGSGDLVPTLTGTPGFHKHYSLTVDNGLGGAGGLLWIGLGKWDLYPFYDGHFYIDLSDFWVKVPFKLSGPNGVPGAGSFTWTGPGMTEYVGVVAYVQATVFDAGASRNIALTNAVALTVEGDVSIFGE